MTDIPLIVFSHGEESGPWGKKIVALAEVALQAGANVISLDYSDLTSPEDRAHRLIGYDLPNHKKLILVGSSMGGYVSTVASETLHPDGLFLMAPAFYLPGYENQHPHAFAKNTYVVHGLQDTVIPIEHSRRFCVEHACPLLEVDSDHRLESALPALVQHFSDWLAGIIAG